MTIELDVRFRFSSAEKPLKNDVCVKYEANFIETVIRIGCIVITLAKAINILFGS